MKPQEKRKFKNTTNFTDKNRLLQVPHPPVVQVRKTSEAQAPHPLKILLKKATRKPYKIVLMNFKKAEIPMKLQKTLKAVTQ